MHIIIYCSLCKFFTDSVYTYLLQLLTLGREWCISQIQMSQCLVSAATLTVTYIGVELLDFAINYIKHMYSFHCIEPVLVDYEPEVYALVDANVTLRCVPDDLRAPVIWEIAE